jgi:phenylalanyl-tRNA synthetase beta chain
VAIARAARALGLQTESSYRFERGVDPALARRAIERATRLLVEIAGGQPGPVIERSVRAKLPAVEPVRLRLARLARVLGTNVPRARVRRVLSRLGMRPRATKDGFSVTPPTHRFDLRIEEDLIEEVARIEGYEKIPAARPRIAVVPPEETETRLGVARLRALLADRDYHEVITYSFVDPRLQSLLDPGQPPYRLTNPLSADMAVMRTSLWPGLLQAVIYNLNRQQARIRLFEIGRCFRPAGGGGVEEWAVLGGVVAGEVWPRQWGAPNRQADFFDVKGDVEALLALGGRGAETVRFRAAAHPALHPGRSAEVLINGVRIGWLGELHPRHRDELGVTQPVLLYELDLEALCTARVPVFEPISRFPAIRRDLSVDLPQEVPAEAVLEKVRDLAGNLLVNLELFDEYRGEGIDYGRKSLALTLTFQDSSRTLKETEVEAIMAKVISGLEAGMGARLRG